MDHDAVSQHEISFNPRGGGGGDGFGFGGGGSGLLLGLLLARGGLFGNDNRRDGNWGVDATNLLQATLGNIQAQIPLVACQTESNINKSVSELALGMQQAFSNTKDAVQNGTVVTLTTANQTQNVVQADGEKTRALIQSINDANLNRELAVTQAALAEERGSRRVRDVEVNVSQVVTQAQAQAQQQAQFSALFSAVQQVCGELQVARATNANLIIGNTGATTTGAQTASPINVRS